MLACGTALSALVIWLHLVREGVKIATDFWLSALAEQSQIFIPLATNGFNSSNETEVRKAVISRVVPIYISIIYISTQTYTHTNAHTHRVHTYLKNL